MTRAIGQKTRGGILALSTLAIIVGTAGLFQLTQTFYKSYTIGKRYFSQGEYLRALPYLITAHAAGPESSGAANYLLWTYQRLGIKKDAAELLQSMWEKNSGSPVVMEELADGFYGMKDYEKAEELYRRILDKEEVFRISRKFAEVLAWQKKYGEALSVIAKLRETRPEETELLKFEAETMANAGQYEKAEAAYKKVLEFFPEDKDTLLKLANTLRYAG